MSTINELKHELEELEKRIKAIGIAQSSLSKLNEISEYFLNVQTYLSILNESYNNHLLDCTEYSTQITELQNQIAAISNKVESLPNGSDVDFTEVQNNITTLQNELSELKNGSTATIMDLEEHIENLEGEHTLMEENISENSTDISTINETLSSMQTTITNLTTTQNSLTSSQSNLTSTVSGINSRLTKAEANISTLTGGVDVAYLDDRINSLEMEAGPVIYYKKIKNINSPEFNTDWHSEIFHFYSKINEPVLISVKFKYEPHTSAETLTLTNYMNNNIFDSTTIDLTDYPKIYENKFMYTTSRYSNTYQAKFSTNLTTDVGFTIKDIEITIQGINVNGCEYTKEITSYAYGGYIYLTRRYDNYIKYGKFSTIDEIDLDNLPNTQSLILNGESYNKLTFIPFPVANKSDDGNYYVEYYSDVFYGECTNNYLKVIKVSPDDTNKLGSLSSIKYSYSTEPVPGILSRPIKMHVNGDRPAVNLHLDGESNYYLKTSSGGYCTAGAYSKVFPARKNFGNIGDQTTNTDNILYVAKRMEDGYFYFFKGFENYPANIKLQKGDYATAFIQEDGSVNVYITENKVVHKYNVTYEKPNAYKTTFTVTYISQIDNCDMAFELLENRILLHRPQAITKIPYWEIK